MKRKPGYISNTKGADVIKSKKFKKRKTFGELRHELKLLATDFEEKNRWIYLYLDYSLSEEEDLE